MKTFQRVIDVLKSDLASGMSVNAIVKKTGITHNAIGAYLEGRSEPTQSSLEKISKAYGKSVAWLRGDVENDAPFMINGVPLEPMPGPSGLIPVVS